MKQEEFKKLPSDEYNKAKRFVKENSGFTEMGDNVSDFCVYVSKCHKKDGKQAWGIFVTNRGLCKDRLKRVETIYDKMTKDAEIPSHLQHLSIET